MTATTRPAISVSESRLFVAFELGKKEWKLALTSGFGVAAGGSGPSPAGDLRGGRRAWSQLGGSGLGCR